MPQPSKRPMKAVGLRTQRAEAGVFVPEAGHYRAVIVWDVFDNVRIELHRCESGAPAPSIHEPAPDPRMD